MSQSPIALIYHRFISLESSNTELLSYSFRISSLKRSLRGLKSKLWWGCVLWKLQRTRDCCFHPRQALAPPLSSRDVPETPAALSTPAVTVTLPSPSPGQSRTISPVKVINSHTLANGALGNRAQIFGEGELSFLQDHMCEGSMRQAQKIIDTLKFINSTFK